MKTVTFHLNRKGKLQPFTCHERTLLFLYLQQKHFNEGEVYCKFSCFTNISTRKDFKEPNWFQSLIKTGYHYYILIQIILLSFLRDHRTSEMIFCTWFLNIMLIFSSTTKQLLCSPMSIIHGGTTGSRVLCVYIWCIHTHKRVSDNARACLTT